MIVSRRTFVRSSLSAATLTFVGKLPSQALATPPQRMSIGELELDDPIVATYREAVRILKSRSAEDNVSWTSMSEVHGTAAGFNHCPHGSWYFLPWHRAYLAMYEHICRTVTGNADFALPYWDWCADRSLPKAFADKTWNGAANPLFEPTRWWSPTGSLPDDMVGEFDVIEPILSETEFELFGTSRPAGQNDLDQKWITAGGGGERAAGEQCP